MSFIITLHPGEKSGDIYIYISQIYIYIYTQKDVFIYTYTHRYMHIHICVYIMYLHTHKHTYAYMQLHILNTHKSDGEYIPINSFIFQLFSASASLCFAKKKINA